MTVSGLSGGDVSVVRACTYRMVSFPKDRLQEDHASQKRCSVTCSRVVHDRDFHCLQIQPWLRAASPKRRAPHRGQRQAGAGAPPTGAGTSAFSPDTTPLMDYTGMDLMNGSIFDQAAAGCLFSFCLKFPVISQSVESVLCGTAGSSGHPGSFAYSRRKNLAPMFMEADRSQL